MATRSPRGADDLHRDPPSALCREHLPCLVEAAATIGAAQIQNRGTLGGNVANASPAGDTLPVLLAADAAFVLGSARGERTVPAAAFWTGYRTTALAPDELSAADPDPDAVRPRDALPQGRDAAGAIDQQGRHGARLARCQRGRAVARRPRWRSGRWRRPRSACRATEAALEGRPPTPETADRAAEILAAELHPIDDVRSTAEYRRLVAARSSTGSSARPAAGDARAPSVRARGPRRP